MSLTGLSGALVLLILLLISPLYLHPVCFPEHTLEAATLLSRAFMTSRFSSHEVQTQQCTRPHQQFQMEKMSKGRGALSLATGWWLSTHRPLVAEGRTERAHCDSGRAQAHPSLPPSASQIGKPFTSAPLTSQRDLFWGFPCSVGTHTLGEWAGLVMRALSPCPWRVSGRVGEETAAHHRPSGWLLQMALTS